MQRTSERKSIAKEVKERVTAPKEKAAEYKGNTEKMTSTGSTLLDLAISGGRVRGGGIPAGIMVEIFGPESSGKTVLLCEIAGYIQRAGGQVLFHDPEARLNTQFAQIFDLDTDEMEYTNPDTVTEVFASIRNWIPDNGQVNGVITDSLAALSTELEMGNEEGDKMGQRRAKEFSEGFRKHNRLLVKSNTLMVCSNQIRENVDRPSRFSPKYTAPGGKAIGFYSSLRLRTSKVGTLTRSQKRKGKEHKVVYAIVVEVEVFKSSVWHPMRTAEITIDFEYGIDDVRDCLKYLKTMDGTSVFCIGDRKLSNSLADSIAIVEKEGLQDELREAVIDVWEELEEGFKVERMKKKR